jgi:Pectate lyase superfamily protein
MPIVSISKIQQRYGLSENLPQLSAAEFGWAIDQRRLYIGNGPTSEGSPAVGNTEILTQYSNLLEATVNSYIYKDSAVGFDAVTGTSALAPTTRSLQEKLDDVANVRDYGAVGNGVDDDTDAINRALYDLYCREESTQVRRTLYFPAGTYLVSDVIKIPSYATIQGEGKSCTVIKSTDDGVSCVARIADSKQQVGAAIGSNGAMLPKYIVVNDITFDSNQLDISVFIINSTKYCSFNSVGFVGSSLTAPTSNGTGATAIAIYSTAVNQSQNILFNDCEISGINFGVILDDDMQNIVFDGCGFTQLYKGIKVGEGTLGSGSSVYGPRGVRVTNSLFDDIYSVGIQTYTAGILTSAYNTFKDVGNHAVGTPSENVVIFGGDGCASINDFFYRTNAEDLTVARISYGNTKTVYINSLVGASVGLRQLSAGGTVTLSDNTAVATSTGITFTTTQKSQRVFYTATRGTNVRSGVLELTATSNGNTLSDNFTEDGTDIGLEFTASVGGSTVTLNYETTSTGDDITFAYSVDRIIA